MLFSDKLTFMLRNDGRLAVLCFLLDWNKQHQDRGCCIWNVFDNKVDEEYFFFFSSVPRQHEKRASLRKEKQPFDN